MIDTAGNLRAASAALEMIERQDSRTWPICARLAEQEREQCLDALLDEMTGRAVPEFTPILMTEQELIDMFGDPAKPSQPKSVLMLEHGGGKRETRSTGVESFGRSPFRKVFR